MPTNNPERNPSSLMMMGCCVDKACTKDTCMVRACGGCAYWARCSRRPIPVAYTRDLGSDMMVFVDDLDEEAT